MGISDLFSVFTILAFALPVAACGGSQGTRVDAADAADAGTEAPADASTERGAPDPSCAVGDGDDGAADTRREYLDLNVTASGFDAHEGLPVYVVTGLANGGVLGVGSATVVGGGFTLHFAGGYQRNRNQAIVWFVDTNRDGICATADGDHIGYLAAAAFNPAANESLDLTITDNHVDTTPGFPESCSRTRPFGDMLDMNILASGFGPHEGQTVHLVTRPVQNGAIFAAGTASVVGGGFAFHFRRAFARFTYQEIFWFVDVDGDGLCTTGVDHPGYTITAAFSPIGTDPIDMPISDNHIDSSARGANVCLVMNGCRLAP